MSPRILQYDEESKTFIDLSNNERLLAKPSTPPLPHQMLLAATEHGAVPLWLLPKEALPRHLPDNWCAKIIKAQDVYQLQVAVAGLTSEQAAWVIHTLPDNLIADWTGEIWPRQIANVIYQQAHQRFVSSLPNDYLEEEPATRDEPLAFDSVQPIELDPRTQAGRKVSLEALDLSVELRDALITNGYSALYTHQALALHYLRQARTNAFDLVLTTPTASGKTMAFAPGIVEDLMNRGGSALFLYPLVALSRDQTDKLQGLTRDLPIKTKPFFGSTTIDQLLEDGTPAMVVATPDKLNYHLDKPNLGGFLAQLRYIVLDEAHAYRGFFGMNMALFLRRLLYLTDNQVRLVISTATLDNTADFVRRLTGRNRFRVVGTSGAPIHQRYFYLGAEKNVHSLVHLVERQRKKGLAFVGGRQEANRRAAEHRSGQFKVAALYSKHPNYDRLLESLRKGKDPLFLYSTTTLEAGIDVGDLQHLAILGFPYNRNAFKQMAGRAGRTGPAHILFIPRTSKSAPADQYYSNKDNLKQLVEAQADPVFINPANLGLLKAHLRQFRYEVQRRNLSDQDLLPHLLAGTSAQGRALESLMSELQAVMGEEVNDAKVPPLRSIPGTSYLVIVLGEGSPSKQQAVVALQEEQPPEWLKGDLKWETAHREWSLGLISLLEGRYYLVLDWTAGHVERSRSREEAVFIWVEDVTDQLKDPEDTLRQEQQGKSVSLHERQRYESPIIDVYAQVKQRIEQATLGPFTSVAGRGRVEVSLAPKKTVHLKRVRYACPEILASKGLGPAVDGLGWQVSFAGSEIPLPHENLRELCQIGHTQLTSGNTKVSYRLERLLGQRLEVSRHGFDSSDFRQCSCGRPSVAMFEWESRLEDPPSLWQHHAVFSTTAREYETDLALIEFKDGSASALWALTNALAKATPTVLEADVSDLGFAVFTKDAVTSFLAYDTIEGGLGVASQLTHRLREVFGEAKRLLQLSSRCGCKGAGCFGCILPFRTLNTAISGGSHSTSEDALGMLEDLELNEPSLEEGIRQAQILVANLLGEGEHSHAPFLILDPGALINPTTQQPYRGVQKTLDHLRNQGAEFLLCTRSDRVQLQEALAPLKELGERLLSNSIVASRKSSHQVMSQLRGRNRREIFLFSPHAEDMQAAHQLGVWAAWCGWADASKDGLSGGPDLLLLEPTDMVEVIHRPHRFEHPLEQFGLALEERTAPVELTRGGQQVMALGRYRAAKEARPVKELLDGSSDILRTFKQQGAQSELLAQYLQQHLSAPVVIVPPKSATKNGLVDLGQALCLQGVEVLDALQWVRSPKPQREVGLGGARKQNVAGALSCQLDLAGKAVVLLDDLVTSGATMAEAKRALEARGAAVSCLALAYTVGAGIQGSLK